MTKFAVICASNQNRSMEAHQILGRKGVNVESYGTNSMIKVPGISADRPNAYPFGTSYAQIRDDLKQKDLTFYTQNGLLMLLERNMSIKEAPQRWQESTKPYDVIITCEARCFDIVCEDLMHRSPHLARPVHVINFDIKDTPEDATVGARDIFGLVQLLENCDDIDNQIDKIIEKYSRESDHPILYNVLFY